MNLELRKQIAESILGQINWENEMQGIITCPGARKHTTTGDTATVFIDGCPNLKCFHHSCMYEVDIWGRKLRFAIMRAENKLKQTGQSQQGSNVVIFQNDDAVDLAESNATICQPEKQEVSAKELRRVKLLAKANLPEIIAQNAFDPDDWCERSPIDLPEQAIREDWRKLLGVMPWDERIWIGALTDSGRPENTRNFRLVREWLEEPGCPGQFISPANFREESFQRSQANIVSTRFLIVESDTLSKTHVSSVFLWLAQSWKLVAVVDTGNKSLHGWFENPANLASKDLALNKAVLDGLGCDVSMLRPSQPCRLPGWLREDNTRWQTLLYLDSMMPKED